MDDQTILFFCLLNCGNHKVVTDSALLTPAENVALVQCVERETLALAKSNGFNCIFTSNSSPLTQVIIRIKITFYKFQF
jgi:hypothetical protein